MDKEEAIQPQPVGTTNQPNETGIKHTNQLVKLNVGGKYFIASEKTLTRGGKQSDFFTSLLSGRFGIQKDEKGRVFIDRSGTIFEPILEYLRTGILELPKGITKSMILREAEFYLLHDLIQLTSSAEEEEQQPTLKTVRMDGYYKLSPLTNDVYKNTLFRCLSFLDNERVICATCADCAVENLRVFKTVEKVPSIWSSSTVCAQHYANFVQHYIRRGKYWCEEGRLKITFSQNEDRCILGVLDDTRLYLNPIDYGYQFVEYTFAPW